MVANLPEKGGKVGWEGLSGFDIQENGSDAIGRMFTMVPDRVKENKIDLFMSSYLWKLSRGEKWRERDKEKSPDEIFLWG